MTKLVDIEGIGPAYEAKFKTAGVTTVEDLLEQGATPQARKALAEKSGVAEQLVLRWVNHADLFRIKGVAGQYAELLEAAGVDSVVAAPLFSDVVKNLTVLMDLPPDDLREEIAQH